MIAREKKNTDVLKKNDKGKHPIAPEFYRRVQAVHGSTFSEDFEISRFSVWLTSCHNPNQPVCCMKQNSIDFWLTIHLLSALFLQETTEDIPSLEEYHSEVSGISKWVCLVWRKPTVIFPQQVTRHQNKPNTRRSCPTILRPWKSPVFKTAQCCFIRLCHLCKSFQHR